MNAEEIKAKAATLAKLYTAVAAGKTLQARNIHTEEWRDVSDGPIGPSLNSDLARWRVKPRAIWIIPSEITGGSANADMRRVYYTEDAAAFGAVKYEEVIPE